MIRKLSRTALLPILIGLAAACGGRPEQWDQAPNITHSVGMASSVALIDEAVHRVSFLTVGAGLSLNVARHPVGVGVLNAQPSPDGQQLYVLTQGMQPRRRADDERPALWVYGKSGSTVSSYVLSEALSGLAVDPEGQFVVAYAAGLTGAFVENPNELILVDVSRPPGADNPLPRTLRSFGGKPKQLTFTPKISLPTGERRLLIIQTDHEINILDLDHLDRPEITVQLNPADGSYTVTPAAVIVDEGDPTRTDDTRIAVRSSDEAAILVLTLAALPASEVGKVPNDFKPIPNKIGLASVPTDFAFVRTDAGLRLAALEPYRLQATLADPETSVTTTVDLPAAYGKMAVVTDKTGTDQTTQSDVALLWGGGASAKGVAFWSLGKSVGEAYRSIEVLNAVAANVNTVVGVPAPNDSLKILVPGSAATTSGEFYVLNLANRTAAPLYTSSTSLALEVSDDGKRAWMYQEGTTSLARVDLSTLHPQNLFLDRAAAGAYDLTRTDGGRALLVLHNGGTMGATVFDAVAPDDATATGHVGLVQGGF